MSIQILHLVESLIQLSMVIMVGLYFTFSNSIMTCLGKIDSGAGVMVEINKVILNPVFMAVFWISGLGSVYLVITAKGLVFIASLVFLVGTTLVTIVKNVPLTNQLQTADAEREQVWQRYLDKWVFWNHVRTVAAISSAMLLVV